MKLKSVFLSALVATSALVSFNANANVNSNPATYETTTIAVAGENVKVESRTTGNKVQVVIGDTKDVFTSYYQVNNVGVLAPSFYNVNVINEALASLHLDARLSSAQYYNVQYNYDADRNK